MRNDCIQCISLHPGVADSQTSHFFCSDISNVRKNLFFFPSVSELSKCICDRWYYQVICPYIEGGNRFFPLRRIQKSRFDDRRGSKEKHDVLHTEERIFFRRLLLMGVKGLCWCSVSHELKSSPLDAVRTRPLVSTTFCKKMRWASWKVHRNRHPVYLPPLGTKGKRNEGMQYMNER